MRKLFCISFMALVFVSCGQGEKAAQENIDQLNRQLSDSPLEEQKELANQLLETYRTFETDFPKSELNAEYLFRRAELNKGLGEAQLAVQNLRRLNKEYPKHDKSGTALFLIAFTFHDDLQNSDSAAFYFEKFIEEYPEHQLKDDAQAYLQLINLSDEELLQFIQEKNDTIN